MRKAINGLSVLVEQAMDLDPFSGNLLAFCHWRRNILEILYQIEIKARHRLNLPW